MPDDSTSVNRKSSSVSSFERSTLQDQSVNGEIFDNLEDSQPFQPQCENNLRNQEKLSQSVSHTTDDDDENKGSNCSESEDQVIQSEEEIIQYETPVQPFQPPILAGQKRAQSPAPRSSSTPKEVIHPGYSSLVDPSTSPRGENLVEQDAGETQIECNTLITPFNPPPLAGQKRDYSPTPPSPPLPPTFITRRGRTTQRND